MDVLSFPLPPSPFRLRRPRPGLPGVPGPEGHGDHVRGTQHRHLQRGVVEPGRGRQESAHTHTHTQ